jgi:hypothetical protein
MQIIMRRSRTVVAIGVGLVVGGYLTYLALKTYWAPILFATNLFCGVAVTIASLVGISRAKSAPTRATFAIRVQEAISAKFETRWQRCARITFKSIEMISLGFIMLCLGIPCVFLVPWPPTAGRVSVMVNVTGISSYVPPVLTTLVVLFDYFLLIRASDTSTSVGWIHLYLLVLFIGIIARQAGYITSVASLPEMLRKTSANAYLVFIVVGLADISSIILISNVLFHSGSGSYWPAPGLVDTRLS